MVGLLLALLAPRSANAQVMDGEAAAGLVVVVVAIGALVTPFGAMVTTIEGEPTKEWGRSSLVFGSISALTGGIAMAAADDDDTLRWFGGIVLTMGINGLLWGAFSEATLPEEDPGIAGRPRPSDSAAALSLRGSF